MMAGVAHLSKSFLKKERTPQLVILDTFRSGVTAALQEAENDEQVWLEVISPPCRTPEMYPGGPRGTLTGSFSSQSQGVIFEPGAILKGWKARGVESFWYSLMGVDRTPYLSNDKLVRDAELLIRYPTANIQKSSRLWLMTAGCIDQDRVTGRWQVIKNLLSHATYLTDDEKRILCLFTSVSKMVDARTQFCSDGSGTEEFDRIFKVLRTRKWLDSVNKASGFILNSRGLTAQTSGSWFKNYRRTK